MKKVLFSKAAIALLLILNINSSFSYATIYINRDKDGKIEFSNKPLGAGWSTTEYKRLREKQETQDTVRAPKLSVDDKLQIGKITEAIERMNSNREKLYSDAKSVQGNRMYVVHLLRTWVSKEKEELREIKKIYPKIENRDFNNLYRKLCVAKNEFTEIELAGAALYEAKERNNTDLFAGLVKSLVSDDAKQLVVPVVSRVDLDYRLQKYNELSDSRFRQINEEMRQMINSIDEKGYDL